MKKDVSKNTKQNSPSKLIIAFITGLSLVLGSILIFATEQLFTTLNYLMVAVFAIIGVVQIINFLLMKDYEYGYYNNLFIGIISIWLALFTYNYYTIFIIILPVILSLYAFIIGASYVVKTCNNRKIKNIIPMVISFIIGIFLIFRPFLTVIMYLKITGVYIILITIYSLIDSIISGREK